MYHSLNIGNYNTWDTWHLIPTSRPVINPPDTKTKYVDLPGGNGQIDLTDALNGWPVYDTRTGSIEFAVAHNYTLDPVRGAVDPTYGEWADRYSDIMNSIQGRYFKTTLEDDPYWTYLGRFSVNDWKSDQHNSVITLDYELYPYKVEPYYSDEDWLWDPFDFETGIVQELHNVTITSPYQRVEIDVDYMPVPLRMTVSGAITKIHLWGDATATFDPKVGEYDYTILQKGHYYLTFDIPIKDISIVKLDGSSVDKNELIYVVDSRDYMIRENYTGTGSVNVHIRRGRL